LTPLGLWLPVKFGTDEAGNPTAAGVTLTVGRYRIILDNSLLGVTSATVANLNTHLPSQKVVNGKTIRLNAFDLDPVKRQLIADVTVITNPIPLALIVGAIGVIGIGAVAILLVREVRKLISLQDVAKSPVAVLILVAVIVLVGVFAFGHYFGKRGSP
jgi:hypothetical protein